MIIAAQKKLADGLDSINGLYTLHQNRFAISTIAANGINLFAVWKLMVDRGWFTSAIVEPVALHLMVQPFHIEVMDDFLADLSAVVKLVEEDKPVSEPEQPRYN